MSKLFHLGKTPGNDCLPNEFHNVFWPLIVEFLVECFNETYERKEMSNSGYGRGVLSRSRKEGKDKIYL